MRKLLTVGLMLLMAALTAFGAAAQDDDLGEDGPPLDEGSIIYGLVNVDRSEVRTGPDFAYPAIGQLPLNTSVTILGRAGQFIYSWDGRQWLQIQYGERKAWMYARLVRTSVRFNRIPVTGMMLPRNANGRVPEEFDLSTYICDRWQGAFTRTGDFMAGDQSITVTFPEMPGASVYSVIVITPGGYRIPFDVNTPQPVSIPLESLPSNTGPYTWSVVPYWTTSTYRYEWQQVCPLYRAGTFEKPETVSRVPNRYS